MTDTKWSLQLRVEALEGWETSSVSMDPRGAVLFHFTHAGDAKVQVAVTPSGAHAEALARTPIGDVAYWEFSGVTEAEAAKLTRAFADAMVEGKISLAAYFPHLALSGVDDDDTARDRVRLLADLRQRLLLGTGSGEAPSASLPAVLSSLHLDPPGLADFLLPEIAIDGPAVAGFVLGAIYLPPFARREQTDFSTYILEFERNGQLAHLLVGPADKMRQRFGVAGCLAVGVRHFGQGDAEGLSPEVASLCSWIIAALTWKQGPGFRLTVPTTVDDVRAFSVPAKRKPASEEPAATTAADSDLEQPPTLNLAIDADCGQACTFCSVKSYLSPSDGGEAELQQLPLQLRRARDHGVRDVRLNGLDPLGFSRILDVAEAIEAYGFRSVTVYSTGRPLRDASLRRAFIDRLPDQLRIVVPLYGVSAEVHDAVTGKSGSFTDVQAAIEGLLGELRRDQVALSTVIVRQNVHQFAPVVTFAAQRGLDLESHLPYPMRQTVRDPYAESALPEAEVIDRILDQLDGLEPGIRGAVVGALASVIAHPCLLWHAEQRRGVRVFGPRAESRRERLDGTEYRSEQFVHGSNAAPEATAFAVTTVPCPHAATCALASICPAEHYAVSRDLFGLEAFKPVSVAELYRADPRRD